MDDALELIDYLPISLKSDEETEYINSLWLAFGNAYGHGDLQFAFLPYHMLYMSFVYCTLWKVRCVYPDYVRLVSIGFGDRAEKAIRDMTDPFAFGAIRESDVFGFLKLIGCSNDGIGRCKQLVQIRNKAAHANLENRIRSTATLETHIGNILKSAQEIQEHCNQIIERIYYIFLNDGVYTDNREYLDDKDQIREALIHDNYFSPKDIEVCKSFDIFRLAYEARFEDKRALHRLLIEEFGGE